MTLGSRAALRAGNTVERPLGWHWGPCNRRCVWPGSNLAWSGGQEVEKGLCRPNRFYPRKPRMDSSRTYHPPLPELKEGVARAVEPGPPYGPRKRACPAPKASAPEPHSAALSTLSGLWRILEPRTIGLGHWGQTSSARIYQSPPARGRYHIPHAHLWGSLTVD